MSTRRAEPTPEGRPAPAGTGADPKTMRLTITAAERRGDIHPVTAAIRRQLNKTGAWPEVHTCVDEVTIFDTGKPPGRTFRRPYWGFTARPCNPRKIRRAWMRPCTPEEPCEYCGPEDLTVELEEVDRRAASVDTLTE